MYSKQFSFFQPFLLGTFQHIVLVHQDVQMIVILGALFAVHLQIFQPLACLLQSWSRGVLLDVSGLEVVEPFLKGSSGQFVEFVHADDIIFWEHLFWCSHAQCVPVALAYAQVVAGMYARQLRLPVVEVVGPLSQVEVDDVDGVDFLDVLVALSARYVLRDGLCHAVEHALQVVKLACLLYLHEDDFVL